MGGAPRCVVCGTNAVGRKYFYFPNPPDIRNKWLEAVNLCEGDYRHSFRVCDAHFQENDFVPLKREGGRQRLKKNVIPTESLKSLPIAHVTEDSKTNKSAKKSYEAYCIICGSHDDDRSYHRFPKLDGESKKKWLDACNVSMQDYYQWMRICGVHFEKAHFCHSDRGGSVRLQKNAIPTLLLSKNDWTPRMACKKRQCERSTVDFDCSSNKSRKLATTALSDGEGESSHEADLINSPLIAEESSYTNDSLLETSRSISTPKAMGMTSNIEEGLSHVMSMSTATETPSRRKILFEETTTSPNEEGELSRSGVALAPTSVTPTSLRNRCSSSVNEKISELGGVTSTPQRKSALLWRYAADIRSPHTRTPNSAKKAVKILQETIEKQKKMNHNLRRKLNRALHRIQTLKSLVTGLKKKNFLSDPVAQHIMVYGIEKVLSSPDTV